MPQEELTSAAAAVTTSLQAVKEYADLVVKGGLAELGNILTDTVGYWRLKNQINVLLKAKKLCEEKGIDHTKILPDVFVPVIESASYTSDETLQDMFAHLLAGHLDPKEQGKIHRSYSHVLAQLSPEDAELLSNWIKHCETMNVAIAYTRNFNSARPFNPIHRESWSNLERLGIIQAYNDTGQCDPTHYVFTLYGDSFARACLGMTDRSYAVRHPKDIEGTISVNRHLTEVIERR